MHWIPAMSSASIERLKRSPGAVVGPIVAPVIEELPRPRAVPYRPQATLWRSKRLPTAPGPASHSHWSQNRMRQPSAIGTSVNASEPPAQLLRAELTLLSVVPGPDALPPH